jgi:GxxExxY protein
MDSSRYEYLARQVFQSALEVHKTMGPGLLESVYEECLLLELRERGFKAEGQVELPLSYKGKKI